MDNSRRSVKNARTSHADSINEIVEAGEVPCDIHTIKQTLTDADCRARRRRRADGNADTAATGPSCIKGTCNAYDLPEEDDQPGRPYISFTAAEVHPTAETATKQSHEA